MLLGDRSLRLGEVRVKTVAGRLFALAGFALRCQGSWCLFLGYGFLRCTFFGRSVLDQGLPGVSSDRGRQFEFRVGIHSCGHDA